MPNTAICYPWRIRGRDHAESRDCPWMGHVSAAAGTVACRRVIALQKRLCPPSQRLRDIFSNATKYVKSSFTKPRASANSAFG